MDLQLKGKVILITGGAKGIGAAIARGCAREGAMPIVVDKDCDAGERLRLELQKLGASYGLTCTNLLPAGNCASAIESTLRDFGRLDVLVNNAGINDNAGLEHGSPEKFVRSLELNLHHYYNMTYYALPALKKSQGCIINIASKVAMTGQGGTSGYAAAKGAILALTREWAAELLPSGVRVNTIVPAEVMTPLYRQWLDTFQNPDEKLAAIVAKIPLVKRITAADEISGRTCIFLSVNM